MRILDAKNNWKYSIAIFSFYVFCTVGSVSAQENQAEIKQTQEYIKKQNVLLKKQDTETMLQSTSSASGDRLLHRPTFQMENFLEGVLPGLTVNTANGYPTSQSELLLRGRSLMIVVDGIPRSDVNIPAHQIESVTVVKDGLGLAAMGMSSGNGVLYITTKRGHKSKMKIGFTAQLAFQQQTNRAKFTNAYDYATLLNEALSNDGYNPLYTAKDLELYKTGASPFTHPDVDWYKELTRKTAPIQQYNLNIRGGGNVANYFIDLNVYDEDGFLKQDKSLNSYNTRENFKKYSMRANTDIKLLPTTTFKFDIFGQMFRETTPGSAVMGSIYPTLHYTPNNAYPIYNPNGTLGGSPNYQNNLYGQLMYSGYNLFPKTDLTLDATLDHKFKDALEGLYVSGTYSYASTYREALDRSKEKYDIYYYWKNPEDMSPDSKDNYLQLTNSSAQENKSSYNRQNRMQNINLSAGYDFALGLNNIKTKLTYLYNDFNIQGTNLPLEKHAVSFGAEYNFNKKYLAEFAISGMSMNQLKPGERWGTFPAIGLGWNIAKEDWFAEKAPSISMLKLRATYGKNGSDGTGAYYRSGTGSLSDYYYTYLKYYKKDGDVGFGQTPANNPVYIEGALPYITKWEKIERFNVGVDFEALSNTLSGSLEFFNDNFSDILLSGARNSNDLLGMAAAKENIGRYRQNGLELDLNYKNRFNDLLVTVGANATMYWTKTTADGGFNYPEQYMERVGRQRNIIFGYVADGIFQNEQEIDEYMKATTIADYIPQPGDIRYADINGDGILDGKDIKAIGTNAPRIDYGIYASAEWKGFGLSMQWAGVANRSVTIKDTPFGINEKGGYGQALEEHMDRWTPSNPDASYPRLSATTNSYNERTSTFWVQSGSYIRLKNIELSYSLPKKIITPLHLSRVKVFTNGYNLLTISPIKDRDPEIAGLLNGKVPNVKAFNFGLNVEF